MSQTREVSSRERAARRSLHAQNSCFYHRDQPSPGYVAGLSRRRSVALNWPNADSRGRGGVDAAVRSPGVGRHPTRLAAPSPPCGVARVRRPVPQLATRPPRGRPGRGRWSGGVRSRRGDGGVRRRVGGSAPCVGRSSGWLAHHLRTCPACSAARPDGGGRDISRRADGWTCGLRGGGLPALGGDVGTGFAGRLRRPAGTAGYDADSPEAGGITPGERQARGCAWSCTARSRATLTWV